MICGKTFLKFNFAISPKLFVASLNLVPSSKTNVASRMKLSLVPRMNDVIYATDQSRAFTEFIHEICGELFKWRTKLFVNPTTLHSSNVKGSEIEV